MSGPAHLPPVTSLVYYLTEACNLRCTYCYLEKNPKRSNTRVGRAAIDFLIRESAGERDLHLRFFGGEPLLEFGLLRETAAYGQKQAARAGKTIRFDTVSNGTLLTPPVVDALKALGVSVMISADGTPETMAANRSFDSTRYTIESFEANARYAIEAGVSRVVRMTVAPGQADIAAGVEYLFAMGFDSIVISLASNGAWQPGTVEDIYRAIGACYLAAARSGALLPLQITNELLLQAHARHHGKSATVGSRFCQAGHQMLGASTDGELYPCHRFVQFGPDFRLGHVIEGWQPQAREPFSRATPETFHDRDCQDCQALPYCVGSCMATNTRSGGDLFAPSKWHCLELRSHVRAVHRIYDSLIGEDNPVLTQFLDDQWRERRAGLMALLISGALDEG